MVIVRVTIRPDFSGLVPVKPSTVPLFHSVSQHSSNYSIETFVPITKAIMTTKPTSITSSAKNDTKGAAKQVLRFFSFSENTPLSVEARLHAPGTQVISKKKKGRHPNLRRKVGRDL